MIKKLGGIMVVAVCLFSIGGCSDTYILLPFGKESSHKISVRVSGISTKGSTISTDGAPSHSTSTVSIKEDGFCISAFQETGNAVPGYATEPIPVDWLFKDKAVTYNSVTSSWAIEGEPKWLNSVDLTFWFWDAYTGSIKANAPAAGKIVFDDYKTTRASKPNCLSFTYSLPASTAAGTKLDADNQHDIIFAHNREFRAFDENDNVAVASSSNSDYSRTDEQVDVRFYHALAEVLFSVSLDDETFEKEVKIVDIAVENVYSAGSCVYDDSKTVESCSKFVWTPIGTADYAYAQVWNTDFSDFVDGTNEPDTFGTAGYTWRKGSYTKNSNTYSIYSTDNKFFMIPQTLGDDARVTVTFEEGGISSTCSASIKGDYWKAGYYYKYKLKYIPSGEETTFSINLVDWDPIPVEIEF